ncbi:MAG: hypothetical protein EOO43_09810 [Flavobacterium sp.]|nr:MAG: hypothetical protein EOO43_09810 [Flavobacterium sp.]
MNKYLSCSEIYDAMKSLAINQTIERKYAYEFKLTNGQVIYVKRLLDSQAYQDEPFRLMIHPALFALKTELQQIEGVKFKFGEKGNMNTAFAKYPNSSTSQSKSNPTKYGIGVNFKSEQALKELINFLRNLVTE